MMIKVQCILSIFLVLIVMIRSHGMMLDPPNRSSLWRFDKTAPINYDDDQNYCGGFGIHWNQNGGKCGVCGDDYALPHPQANENTGTYGTGKIVAEYKAGEIITTHVDLSTNHLGYFEYHLCKITNSNKPETGESCFKQLIFEDGRTKFQITAGVNKVNNRVRLPKDFKCKHCVLRWHYRVANSWGTCEDGSEGMGCGPQEVFRSCSDIRIN